MKIGYLALSKASWMTPDIKRLVADTVREIAAIPGVEWVGSVEPATDEAAAAVAARQIATAHAEAVVLHFATFPAGALIPAAAQELEVPIILLANPEKATVDKMWTQNSFCGANLGAFVLKRLGKKYTFVRTSVAETAAQLAIPLAAARGIAELRTARIGLAGGRVPGFFTSNFDEMKMRRTFGTAVEVMELLEVVHTAEKLTPVELDFAAETVRRSAAGSLDVSAGDLELAAKLFGAFLKMRTSYRLDAYAVRCWPELSDIFGIAPCAVLGMLGAEQIPASCEGDVPGAFTMLLLRSLAGGGIPIFVDLISYDEERNSGVIWHCGAAPVTLCRNFAETCFRKHLRVDGGDRKGVTNDFSLRPGRITVAKLDCDENGRYRMLIAPGEAVDTEPFIRGNPLEIRFDAPIGRIVDTIMKRGFEHHYAAIHADVAPQLLQFCEWMGIEAVYLK